MPNLASLYTVIRGSKSFIVGLATFAAIWITFHFIEGFDREFGLYNTIMSTEASLSTALISMVSVEQARAQKLQADALAKAVEEIKRIGLAQLAVTAAERDILEDHTEMLRELGVGANRTTEHE